MRFTAILILSLFAFVAKSQPCTTTNATGCSCADGRDTCLLLPDLTISWDAILTYMSGPNEYPQTNAGTSQQGQGSDNGRLRLTGSTPNIGYGSFTVRGSNYFLCGSDTIVDPNRNPTCSSGNSPTNLLVQRIYKKMGNTMTYEDHWAGGQTFHPTHGHNHVDDWVSFTLRIEDPNNPDTLSWQIIGDGAKIGFCLMDYGSCSNYNGHCRDVQKYNQGNILTNSNFPNYGLGGGQYNCSPVEQGISSGWTDIYSEALDGMWINIPPGICNGNYWIVAQVDPLNNFKESDESNNWTAVPFTLTRQSAPGNTTATVSINGNRYLCNSESVTLTSNLASSYLWSNGATTREITVTDGGNYYVQTTSTCGTATSTPIEIIKTETAFSEVIADTSCQAKVLTLTAHGSGTTEWYDEELNGNLLDTGAVFQTPAINTTTTYYAQLRNIANSQTVYSSPLNHSGSSQYSGTQYNGYIIFDALQPFKLKTVKVYTDTEAVRIIELRNEAGVVLQSKTVNIPVGTSRVTLNFDIPTGTNLQLGTNTDQNMQLFGYESPKLQRSGTGVTYPYTIANLVSLTNSPNGTAYYYYFYDWEIYTEVSCVSERVAVTALFNNLPTVTVNSLDTEYEIYSGVVQLTGTPSGGVFSGTGVVGNTFDPQLAGVGGPYTITYEYTDANSNCSNFATTTTSVFENPTSVKNATTNDKINIYPNPTLETLNISFNSKEKSILIKIMNALGEVVAVRNFASENQQKNTALEVSHFSRGVYFGTVEAGNNTFNFRFIKQ